jgi:hypothetical protein
VDATTKARTRTGNKLPIVLPPEQKFLVELSFGTISAISASQDVLVVLWGTLFREVQ